MDISGLGGAGTGGAGVGGGSSYQSSGQQGDNGGADSSRSGSGNRGFQLNFVGGTGNTQRNDQGINEPDAGFGFKPLLYVAAGVVALIVFKKYAK